jgi:hypothetical protein
LPTLRPMSGARRQRYFSRLARVVAEAGNADIRSAVLL